MANTHEHLEHAEHAQHQAHDPFSARVGLSMAIIAALLAAVTVFSHRAHNETLQAQIEAGILQARANDQWSFYQAKNIRDHEYQALNDLLGVLAKEQGKETPAAQLSAKWLSQVDKYEHKDLPDLMAKARGLEAEAQAKRDESDHAHHKGARFDLAELAVEVGLVLCSIAVLTKNRGFWFAGIAAAVVGVLLAASVLFMTGHAEAHGHDTASTEHGTTQKEQGHDEPAKH